MTFGTAASVALDKINMCILALEIQEETPDKKINRRVVINPGNAYTIDVKICEAFVVAGDKKDALRLSRYVDHHTENSHDHSVSTAATDDDSDNGAAESGNPPFRSSKFKDMTCLPSMPVLTNRPTVLTTLDATGYFYWVHKQTFESRLLNPTRVYDLKDHIIICILEKHASRGSLGLFNFVMPLRAGVISEDKIQKIVFVGNANIVRREWKTLQNFPKLYILDTSPMNRAHLRAVNIEQCSACIILAPRTPNPLVGDASNLFLDNETVLCTLNIKTMVNRMTNQLLGDSIHIMTELNCGQAINFLDQDDEQIVDDVFMTQAFATGRTFLQELLDNLLCSAFFNRASVDFLRTMVTTVNSEDFEVVLNNQGFQMRGFKDFENGEFNYRSQIQLLPVCEEPANSVYSIVSKRWKKFCLEMIDVCEIICLGISRLQTDTKEHRYVITFPPSDMVIRPDDKIFCLTPPLKAVRASESSSA